MRCTCMSFLTKILVSCAVSSRSRAVSHFPDPAEGTQAFVLSTKTCVQTLSDTFPRTDPDTVETHCLVIEQLIIDDPQLLQLIQRQVQDYCRYFHLAMAQAREEIWQDKMLRFEMRKGM